jgi:hypothetical protein
VGIRVHFFGNQSTQFIHPLEERILGPIQAVVPNPAKLERTDIEQYEERIVRAVAGVDMGGSAIN